MLRPLLVIIIALIGVGALGGTNVRAQAPIEIRVSDAALETALAQVRTQTNLDLVYADRLVRDRTASCTRSARTPVPVSTHSSAAARSEPSYVQLAVRSRTSRSA